MAELFDALGLEPNILLVNIAGFVLLVLLLKRFAFGPIGDILDDRARAVETTLNEAAQARQAALADKQHIEAELARLDERRREIIAQAERAAEERRQEIIRRADEQSQRIVEEGRRALERAAEEARERLRAETAAIAVAISERVLRHALDEERQAALVEAFIGDIERLAAQEQGEGI